MESVGLVIVGVAAVLTVAYMIWLRRRIDAANLQAECAVCGETTYTSANGIKALADRAGIGYPDVLVFVSCWCCNASLYEGLVGQDSIRRRFTMGVTKETQDHVDQYNYTVAMEHLPKELAAKYLSKPNKAGPLPPDEVDEDD